MLEIGSLVYGKYKILNVVGQGGMSVVYMAVDEKANQTWAIKEVRKDGEVDYESVKQSLITEIDILKKLNHPNMPRIVDVFDAKDSFIIVMDYIQGNSLNKILREYGAQPQEYVIEWAKQLCDVLGYLHSRKPPIIYRDMKPSNIMLKPDGNVALIDFGTAREFKKMNLADTTCLGTIGYAAPEQFGGMGQTDARTDIYCLGITLYELITGCSPRNSPYEMKPFRQINPSLSNGLENIIQKCTQRNPDDRYQSAAELMYALEHYEEYDDKYRKKQKIKLSVFIITAVLAAAFFAGGVVLDDHSLQNESENNEFAVNELNDSTDTDDENNINVVSVVSVDSVDSVDTPDQPMNKEAYIRSIQSYKENDNVFTTKEEDDLNKLLDENKDTIISNPNDCSDICYEIGRLYWYYYSTDSENDDQYSGVIKSSEWFEKTIENASEVSEYLSLAKMYYNTSVLYKDIDVNTNYETDEGRFRELFHNLTQLIDLETKKYNNPEFEKLELLELVRSTIQKYAVNFKSDNVTYDEINLMISHIEFLASSTNEYSEKKDSILSSMDDTRKAVDSAYITDGGMVNYDN